MEQKKQTMIVLAFLIVAIGLWATFSNEPVDKGTREYSQTAVVYPTSTPVPTTTPTPTLIFEQQGMMVLNSQTAVASNPIAPLFTPTPAPTLVPRSFTKGGEYEQIASIWLGRLLAAVFVGIAIALIFIFREIKIYELQLAQEVKLKEIESMKQMGINPRPVLSSKKTTQEGKNYTTLSSGKSISQELIIDFLQEILFVDDNLAISKWKSRPGWTQTDIESILDHLAVAKMVSERQNGRSCAWETVPDKRVLAHIFRLSTFEIEEPEK